MSKQCATCTHWQGNSSTYQALCGIVGNNYGSVAFDYVCDLWAAQEAAQGVVGMQSQCRTFAAFEDGLLFFEALHSGAYRPND